MSTQVQWFEDVQVGMELPEVRWRPSTVQLFRFSAVTWNAHRIHFDRPYAQREGYSDVLVQSQLHGCVIAKAVTDWLGPHGTLRSFLWRNHAPAVPGTELTVRGVVRRVQAATEVGEVEIELEERDEHDVLCAPANATVILPRRIPTAARTERGREPQGGSDER